MTQKEVETYNREQKNKVITMLDTVNDKAYAEKNFIMFMSQYPEGMRQQDIAFLCYDFSDWFGDYGNLAQRFF